MKVASVQQMREMDRKAQEEFGLTEEILMENAGIAAFSVIKKEFGVREKRFSIFCGTGNNGGDGFVLARKLASEGAFVTVFIVGDLKKMKGSSKTNFERIQKAGIETIEIRRLNQIVCISILKSDVIVDALFGTGLSKQIEGIHAEVIDEINRSNKPVVSIDVPSGLNADTGEIMGKCVKADISVTFGLPKVGFFNYPGASNTGKLYVSHISFPAKLYESNDIKTYINIPDSLPERKRDGNKGDFGKGLFISGSASFLGAPLLSSAAFLKTGGGVSYLAAPRSIIYSACPPQREVVLLPQEETKSGSIALSNLERILDFSKKVDVVSVGQGLSLDEETEKLFNALAEELEKPLLIDGDGLTFLSKNPKLIMKRKSPTILTPHPGEFARLCGGSIKEVLSNRFDLVRKMASQLNCIIVLKGAFSLVSDGKEVYINPTGNSGMATAGSGDVLDGIISAFAALGMSPLNAARTGTFIHGLSGDIEAKEVGEDGITAGDILNGIPKAVKYFRESYNLILEGNYERARVV